MMKWYLVAGLLTTVATPLAAQPPNCWWDGAGMHCRPGWTWQDRREWREEHWRREMARRHHDYEEEEHERRPDWDWRR